MKIVLCGYMGAGKSLIGKKIAKKLSFHFVDLDKKIADREQLGIPEIFAEKGEIHFRKTEASLLRETLNSEENMVLALGGGTPCYGQNLQWIKDHPETILIYLKMNLQALTDRLFEERKNRPLISNVDTRDALEDFIRKHIFERRYYYLQSDYTVDCSTASPGEIVMEILAETGRAGGEDS